MEGAGFVTELLFVDDSSNDGTEEIAWALRNEHPERDIVVLVRSPEEGTGLSSAVMLGLVRAKHSIAVVMDADLSHPPEVIPQMIGWLADEQRGARAKAPLASSGPGDAPVVGAAAELDGVEDDAAGRIDFVLGSRYAYGGQVAKDWPWWRRIISGGATLVARPLVGVSDPMSGFFALRKDQLAECSGVNAVGFKIGLELMVNCDVERVAEAPIVFHDRVAGTSKLKLRTALLYVGQLMSLYWSHFFATSVAIMVLKVMLLGYGVWRVRHRVSGDDWRPQLGAVVLWLPDLVAIWALVRGHEGVLHEKARPRRLSIGVEERKYGCCAFQRPAVGYVSVFGGGLPTARLSVGSSTAAGVGSPPSVVGVAVRPAATSISERQD